MLQANLAGHFGGSIRLLNLAGLFGCSIWRVNLAAQFGGSFWRLILAGQFGGSIWRVILASQFGMQQFILMKQLLREGCWHEASCLCCGKPEVAHARAPLGSEGSRRRGINTGIIRGD
jgi:hypothetical protein